MEATTFTATPSSGTAPLVSNNSTLGATTAFVKSFITTYLIPLADTITLTATNTLIFTSVRLTVLKGLNVTLNIQGTNVNLGQSTTTIKAFDSGSGGITFPMDTNYPYILSSAITTGRIQAGYAPGTLTTTTITTPIPPSGSSSAYVTPNVDLVTGISIPSGTSFNVRSASAVSAQYYWIMFQSGV
jgi:hypothetical protein